MGRTLHYVPGSYYRQCDRTGFPERSYHTKKEWQGLIVRERSWEARQPQDFVRGVRDDQTVWEARPLPRPTFVPLACSWDLPSVFWDESSATFTENSEPNTAVNWDTGFGS